MDPNGAILVHSRPFLAIGFDKDPYVAIGTHMQPL